MRTFTSFALAVAAILLGPAPASAAGYVESFEQGMGGWTADYYLECEHQVPPCSGLQWLVKRTTEEAYDGQWSLLAYINGEHDDGTIWVERQFTPPAGTSKATVHFWLWSECDCPVNAFPVVAFIGGYNPETEADFTIIGEDNQAKGWHPYEYTGSPGPSVEMSFWIAFGYGATWETERTHFLDYVEVTFSS